MLEKPQFRTLNIFDVTNDFKLKNEVGRKIFLCEKKIF